MKCLNCGDTKVRTRTNYPYGRKSRPRTVMFCAGCGSTHIESNERRKFRRR